MHVSRVTSKNEGEPQIDKSFKSISLSLNECFAFPIYSSSVLLGLTQKGSISMTLQLGAGWVD